MASGANGQDEGRDGGKARRRKAGKPEAREKVDVNLSLPAVVARKLAIAAANLGIPKSDVAAMILGPALSKWRVQGEDDRDDAAA